MRLVHTWLVPLLLCLLLLLLPACGPAPTATTLGTPGNAPLAAESAPASEPDKVMPGDSLTIALPMLKDEKTGGFYGAQQDYMTRLQTLLYGAGWKINPVLLPYTIPDGQSRNDVILNVISAGHAPDAWYVSADIAKQLRAVGLTRDMADVLPRAAPMLWETCKGAFAGAVDGVPMSLDTITHVHPVALLMSTAALTAYGQPIANAEDVLTYLEKMPDAAISGGYDEAAQLLTDAWAAQKGYYALADFGLPGFFYARQDDPGCKIVPAEDLPGFADFYLRASRLQAQWRLLGPMGVFAPDSTKETGMLTRMVKHADPSLQQHLGLMGKDITALPLAGCNPAPTADTPTVYSMLAVAGSSDKADAVAAFAQWALTDPKGYDLCTLGQQGKDYRNVDDRVEYLKAGVPFTPSDWEYSPTSSVFFLFGPSMGSMNSFVYNPTMQRFTVYEASNADRVLAGYKTVTPPIWKAKALRGDLPKVWREFNAILQPYEERMYQRERDLNYSVGRVNNVPQFTPEQVLQQLQDNRRNLDPLIRDLSGLLKQLLDNPDADSAATTP